MSVLSQRIARLPSSRNPEGLEATEAARLGERSLLERLADAYAEREQQEVTRIDALLERCSDRLREELWQRLQVRVSRHQIEKTGLRSVVTVEGLQFSVFIDDADRAGLQVQLPCPRCQSGFWSVPVRNLTQLAALRADPRFFTHDCDAEGRW